MTGCRMLAEPCHPPMPGRVSRMRVGVAGTNDDPPPPKRPAMSTTTWAGTEARMHTWLLPLAATVAALAVAWGPGRKLTFDTKGIAPPHG